MTLSVRTLDPKRAVKRRRIAAWLMMAWMASWLLTVLQPCCLGIFGTAKAEVAIAVTPAASIADGAPINDDRDPLCDTFVSQQSAWQVNALPLSGGSGSKTPWVGSLASIASTGSTPATRVMPTDPIPPPRVPVYLRTSRILV